MITIFDFDGTLADTLEASIQIYQELAAQHGLTPLEASELPALREMGAKQVLAHLGISKFRVPSLLLQGRKLLRQRLLEIPLIVGMEETLKTLRERQPNLGILTSNSTENVELFLKVHGLSHYFEFISSTSKLSGKHKHLRAIARTFSVPTSHLLYIGDEIRDIKAAKKAGTRSVAVTWGFNSPQSLSNEHPDHLVNTPAELLNLALPPFF